MEFNINDNLRIHFALVPVCTHSVKHFSTCRLTVIMFEANVSVHMSVRNTTFDFYKTEWFTSFSKCSNAQDLCDVQIWILMWGLLTKFGKYILYCVSLNIHFHSTAYFENDFIALKYITPSRSTNFGNCIIHCTFVNIDTNIISFCIQ